MNLNRIELSKVKRFGLSTAVLLLLWGILKFLQGNMLLSFCFNVCALVVLICAVFLPRYMRFDYFLAVKIGTVLSWLNIRIILFGIFYGILFPLSFVMKALRKEFLDVKTAKPGSSYWVSNPENGEEGNFEKQY
ncbi:MAG: SxtJ family membrane protein [Candidatus Omnitrophota bacterium]|jgi:hypothetical protein